MSALDPIGTVYLSPTGDVYRLRDYTIDWLAEPFTGISDRPYYNVMLVRGGFTDSRELPGGSVTIWSPEVSHA